MEPTKAHIYEMHMFGSGHKVIIVMMGLRVYLVLRLLRDYSPAYSMRHFIRRDYE